MANLLVWNIQQLSTPKIERDQFAHYMQELLGGNIFSALMILELTADQEKAETVVNWFKDVMELFEGDSNWAFKISEKTAEGRRADRCALIYHKNYLSDVSLETLTEEHKTLFKGYRVPAIFKAKRGSETVYFLGYHGPSPSAAQTIRMDRLANLAALPVMDEDNVILAGDFNLNYKSDTYDDLTERGNNPYLNTRIDKTEGTTVRLSVPSWSDQLTTGHAYDQIFVPKNSPLFSHAQSRTLTQLVRGLIGRTFTTEPDKGESEQIIFNYRETLWENDPRPVQDLDELEQAEEVDEDDGGPVPMNIEGHDPNQHLIETNNDAVWFFRKISDHVPVLLMEKGFDVLQPDEHPMSDFDDASQAAQKKRRKTEEEVLNSVALTSPVTPFSNIPTKNFVTPSPVLDRPVPLFEKADQDASRATREEVSGIEAVLKFKFPDLAGLTDKAKVDYFINEFAENGRKNYAGSALVSLAESIEVVEYSDDSEITEVPSKKRPRE